MPSSVLKAKIQTPRTFCSMPQGTFCLMGKMERAMSMVSRTSWLNMQVGKGAERFSGRGMSRQIRMSVLWLVREKGVKADKYDSVDDADGGNARNSGEFSFGDVDCCTLSGDAY